MPLFESYLLAFDLDPWQLDPCLAIDLLRACPGRLHTASADLDATLRALDGALPAEVAIYLREGVDEAAAILRDGVRRAALVRTLGKEPELAPAPGSVECFQHAFDATCFADRLFRHARDVLDAGSTEACRTVLEAAGRILAWAQAAFHGLRLENQTGTRSDPIVAAEAARAARLHEALRELPKELDTLDAWSQHPCLRHFLEEHRPRRRAVPIPEPGYVEILDLPGEHPDASALLGVTPEDCTDEHIAARFRMQRERLASSATTRPRFHHFLRWRLERARDGLLRRAGDPSAFLAGLKRSCSASGRLRRDSARQRVDTFARKRAFAAARDVLTHQNTLLAALEDRDEDLATLDEGLEGLEQAVEHALDCIRAAPGSTDPALRWVGSLYGRLLDLRPVLARCEEDAERWQGLLHEALIRPG